MTGTKHKDFYTFVIIPPSVLLRMKNVSDECSRESQNTHVMFSKVFSSEKRARNEIMSGNMVEPDWP
jgi:hypothetical protein